MTEGEMKSEVGVPLADDGIETGDGKRSRATSMIHLIACFFLIGARVAFDGGYAVTMLPRPKLSRTR